MVLNKKGEYYDSVKHIDERPPLARHFLNKDELCQVLLATLFQQGATVWEIPSESKFINSIKPHFAILNDLKVGLQMGDIPLFFQGHFYFLKVLFFTRKRAQTALGLRPGERDLTRPQIEVLSQGDGLLLLINEPPVELPGLQGEAYIQGYYSAIDRGDIAYEVLLLDQQDFLHFQEQYLPQKESKRFTFTKVSADFTPKLQKFTYREIIQGILAAYILKIPSFSLEKPAHLPVAKKKPVPEEKKKPAPEEKKKPAPEVEGELLTEDDLARIIRVSLTSKSQLRLWKVLLNGNEFTLGELANILGLHPKTITSNLQALVSEGIVRERTLPYKSASVNKSYQLDFNAPKVRQLCVFLADFLAKLSQSAAVMPEKPFQEPILDKPEKPVPPLREPTLETPEKPALPPPTPIPSPQPHVPTPPQIPRESMLRILQIFYKTDLVTRLDLEKQVKLDPQIVQQALNTLLQAGIIQEQKAFGLIPEYPLRDFYEEIPMPPKTPKDEIKPLVPPPKITPTPKPSVQGILTNPLLKSDTNSAILSTLGYHEEQVSNVLAALGGQENLLLHDFTKSSKVKVEPLLQKIQRSLSPSVTLHIEPIHPLEIDALRKVISTWIKEKYEAGKSIYLHLSGGSQRLTVAVLLAAYLDFDKITGLLHSTRETSSPYFLPIFPWHATTIPPPEPLVKGQLDLTSVLQVLTKSPNKSPAPPEPESEKKKVLISTYGVQYEPLIRTVKELGATQVILLHTLTTKETAYQMGRLSKGVTATVQNHSVPDRDLGQVIKLLFELIQRELQAGNQVLLNLSGGVDKLTIAMLFISYLTHDKIASLTYSPQEGLPLHLPLLPWRLEPKERGIP